VPGIVARRLLAHIALRLMAATVLLGAAFVLELRSPGSVAVESFFGLIAAVYAVSLVFIASVRFVERFPWLTDVHFAVDVLIISVAVALTGGLVSLFTSLYVLPIVAASIMQFRRGALQVAILGALLYAGIVFAQYAQSVGAMEPIFGLTIGGELPKSSVAQYTVGLNVFGLFAVALLSGSLAERARRADVNLEKASEQLADLQFFNQYVIDNLVSGLATADEDNRLLTFNRSAVLITGHGIASVIGKHAADVLQLPAAFEASLAEDIQRARSKRGDQQYQRPDDRLIDLGLSVAQLPMPNGRVGYLYTFQDVTEVRRLEREGQLQKRLAVVGEMAAGIAHEIRNPLAAMSGSMQILRQELPLSGDQALLMDIVLRESERLNETIRSFLAYARPQRFEMQQLDLRGVIQDTATILRNSTEIGERHTITMNLPDEDVLVEADENQVRQIVWNLATNGLRAMPDGGALDLSASRESIEGVLRGVLTVTDHGVGIPADEIEGIFQPFRGSFGKGTGLGLAIVHRIISDYNARVDVKSEPGEGTTFRVIFAPVRGSQKSSRHFVHAQAAEHTS
jgi:two-component system sensor histidine kinase PilS (NtrC family)